MSYEAVIGLEVHAQLLTNSKIFCNCSTKFGAAPNAQTCPRCLGLPGVLPKLNQKVVEYAVMLGLSTHCGINKGSCFARKNYFYPDLPKGYQVSQFDLPICSSGHLIIKDDGKEKRIGITRIHMEEDAGKLIHEGNHSLVDLNRTGTPLLEIVSEPDMRTSAEAVAYLKELRQVMLYLGICDGNMEEGSFRCDANISVRKKGDTKLGTRAELKNINSFRFIQKAIDYEIERQIDLLETGERVVQETRLFDPGKGITISMRSKEEAHDYRYFPEPDLMPVLFDDVFVEKVKQGLPETPYDKKRRFVQEYGIPEYDIEVLAADKDVALFYEQCVKLYNNPKAISNFFMTEVLKELNERKAGINDTKLRPEHIAELHRLMDENKINANGVKAILPHVMNTGNAPALFIEELGLAQISGEDELASAIDETLRGNKAELRAYLEGKDKLFSFFVGQVMKKTKGKANPKVLNDLIKKRLSGISIDNVDNF